MAEERRKDKWRPPDPWGRRKPPETIKRDIDDGDELQRLLAGAVDCTITDFVITFRLKGRGYIEITASHEQGEVFVTLIEADA